ncbi:MAG: metallophosphoesterase family protein [Lactobacillaceae bacterium]|jgi:putative phosphoesterase|nr:metallophosphoesterase family protein [Lactobacillaceae bacterium]
MQQRIALISDVHGNQTALTAVLADAERQGATEYWYLGDLLMPGPGTNSLFELLNQVNLTVLLKGNWDNFIFEMTNLGSATVDLTNTQDVYIAALVQYVKQTLKPAYYRQLDQAPIQQTIQRAGLTFSLTHNLPLRNYGHQLLPFQEQANFNRLFSEAPKNKNRVDIAIYGHTHHQIMRTSQTDQLVINPGSIGQPYSAWPRLFTDHRSQYALLSLDEQGYDGLEFRKVSYDLTAELKIARQQKLPYFELYQQVCETGLASTHNPVALDQLNQRYGYVAQVHQFLQQLDQQLNANK